MAGPRWRRGNLPKDAASKGGKTDSGGSPQHKHIPAEASLVLIHTRGRYFYGDVPHLLNEIKGI
jgi:hypothetical protein